MTDWTTGRMILEVVADLPKSDGTTVSVRKYLPMANNISITQRQSYELVHGTGPGEFNGGIAKKIPSYSLNIEVYAAEGNLENTQIASSCRLLRSLMHGRKKFKTVVAERKMVDGVITQISSGDEAYQLFVEEFDMCYVSSMSIRHDQEQMPIASFECVAFRFTPSYVTSNEDGIIAHTLLETSIGDGELQALKTDAQSLLNIQHLFQWK